MITNNSEGNYEFTNLPRKFNIALEGSREDSIHSEINDIAFIPAFKDGTENSELGFNVIVGGFFSARRCDSAIPLDAWVPADDTVVEICRAILTVFRDKGSRGNRQQTRLMWLIEAMGLPEFRSAVEAQMGQTLEPAAPADAITEEGKSDHLGVHSQKQPGLNYVGLHVPVGHIYAEDMFEFARLAEVYGNGEIRLTVEQNLIIPNIADARLEAFLQEEAVQKFSVDPSPLVRKAVSCTGSRFCDFALIETKQRAHALAQALDKALTVPEGVRMHWTGCPNSCGQPQVADIGFLGTKARKDGKSVEGGRYLHGRQGGQTCSAGRACNESSALRGFARRLFLACYKKSLERYQVGLNERLLRLNSHFPAWHLLICILLGHQKRSPKAATFRLRLNRFAFKKPDGWAKAKRIHTLRSIAQDDWENFYQSRLRKVQNTAPDLVCFLFIVCRLVQLSTLCYNNCSRVWPDARSSWHDWLVQRSFNGACPHHHWDAASTNLGLALLTPAC